MKKFLSLLLIFFIFTNIDCNKDIMNLNICVHKMNKFNETKKFNCHEENGEEESCSCPEQKLIIPDSNFSKIQFLILLNTSPLNTTLLLIPSSIKELYLIINTNLSFFINQDIQHLKSIQLNI